MSRYYEEEEMEVERPSLWAQLRSLVFRSRTELEDEPTTDTTPTVRYRQFHPYRVAIRREIYTLEDARLAADGLKEGVQQILNLASTPPGMRERILDFLNGVVYTLEGSAERVSEHVFVYAPPQAIIDAPSTTARPRPEEG